MSLQDKSRNASLDIIRTVAVLLTICVHFITNSGFIGSYIDSPQSFIMLMAWLLSKSCVPLFLMLSGWLCINKRLSGAYYLGIIRILVVYVFASLVCIVFEHFAHGEELSLRYIFGSIVNFYACYYGWYVSLYLGLFIMMPFLNAMYHAMETKRSKQILLLSFFAVSILPSLLNSYIQLYSLWWEKLWPITLYFTGAYLREYSPKISAKKAGLLLCAVLLVFAAYDFFYFKADAALANSIDYNHYQNYIISLLAFLFLSKLPADRLSAKTAGAFRKISELSFAVYLLSSVSDGLIYPEFVKYVPEYADRYIWLPVMVLISFVISFVLAWLISLVYEPCIKILHSFFKSKVKA